MSVRSTFHPNGDGTFTISREWLRENLAYEPLTGEFRWLRRQTNALPVDAIAGGVSVRGYVCIQIGGRKYKAHALAWFMTHGEWPALLDHINGDTADNRLSNLRPATVRQNQFNAKRRVDNKSGFKGVSFHRATGKWAATISTGYGRKHLGLHLTPADAYAAYCAAAETYHGEFARVA